MSGLKENSRVDAFERNGNVNLVCVHGWCLTVAAVGVHVEQKDMPEERMICVSR